MRETLHVEHIDMSVVVMNSPAAKTIKYWRTSDTLLKKEQDEPWRSTGVGKRCLVPALGSPTGRRSLEDRHVSDGQLHVSKQSMRQKGACFGQPFLVDGVSE